MKARGLLLAAATLSLASVCAQFTSTNTFPFSGNSYSVDYSNGFSSSYSIYPMMPVQLSAQSQQGVNKNPTFEFLNPSGLRITIPGPYPQSQVYVVKFHININRDFNGVKRGEWDEEVNIPSGSQWAHTFPAIRLRQGDTIYYWVEVVGKQGLSTWFREYKGFYQVPLQNPHDSQTSVLPLIHQPQESGGSSSVLNPSGFYINPLQPPATGPNTFGSQTISSAAEDPPPKKPQVPPREPSSSVDTSFYPIPLTDKDDKTNECRSSSTVFNNGQKPCGGKAFVDMFHFDSVIQIAGDLPEDVFTVFSKDNVIRTDPGYRSAIDTITPSLLVDRYGPKSEDKSLTLTDCTSKKPELCTAQGMGYIILPPIISGRETTEYTLSFCYGVLEVTAKLPKGDWIVPELWLVPKNQGSSGSSGRIVLAKSVGNSELTDGVKDYSNRVLEAGVEYGNGKQMMFKKVQSRPWSDSYHKFKLVWTPDLIGFYVDDQEIGHVHQDAATTSKLQPFDQECYLVFGVHVGGDKDFPDNLLGKPWENKEPKNKLKFWLDRSKWQKTWTDDRSLIISGISLTALDQ